MTIGSAKLDQESQANGGPPRPMDFGEFWAGRYLVTNAQFAAFVQTDGYTNADYWSGDISRGWVRGESALIARLKDHWIKTLHDHHAKEIRDGEIDLSDIDAEAARRVEPRLEPYYWLDRRFNRPNQPVVGINWWEAAAFCRWATVRGHKSGSLATDEELALPTEFEWEFMCRAVDDDRRYPWGEDWSDDRAHVGSNVLNIRRPAPVGVYRPDGLGYDLLDLAGNVWEWTSSLHHPMAAEFDQRRTSELSLEPRVVRGSSWYSTSELASCSARAIDRAYNLFYDVGFRVVAVKAGSSRPGTF